MGASAPADAAVEARKALDCAASARLAKRDCAAAAADVAGAVSPAALAPRWAIPHACGPVCLGGGRYRFRIWAPHGEDVELELEGRAAAPMTRVGDFWEVELAVTPGDRYRIALGSSWNDCFKTEGARLLRRDPCAREVDFDGDWCVVPKPPAARPPAAVPLPTKDELVIYEMHLGTWVPAEAEEAGEVFLAATKALEYVAALSFNCVQLMPVVEFGGLWGYNPRQLMAVHGPWGRADHLRDFIARAHDLGIAVLFDVVLNHGSSKRNSLWNWDGFGKDNCGGIYFEGEKDTPWGRRFAFHKPEVRDYLKECCRVWIEEYHCDGLRMDSVHNMPWLLLQELTWEIKAAYPEQILIAEITPENPAVVNDAGFHSCWLHATHFDALKIMKRFDGGDDKIMRLKMLKGMASLHGGRFPNCGGVQSVLGSHDQIGDRQGGNQDGRGTHRYFVSRVGGRSNWHARAQTRAWFCFQNCMKGLPMTFMGSETLQNGWWHLDKSHRFQWSLATGDDEVATEMRRAVTASNELRRSSDAFTSDNLRIVHEDTEHTVLGLMRWAGDDAYLCIAHLSESQWTSGDYVVDTGWGSGREWELVLNSQAADFGGWADSCMSKVIADDRGKVRLSLPKWSCVVLKSSGVAGASAVRTQ